MRLKEQTRIEGESGLSRCVPRSVCHQRVPSSYRCTRERHAIREKFVSTRLDEEGCRLFLTWVTNRVVWEVFTNNSLTYFVATDVTVSRTVFETVGGWTTVECLSGPKDVDGRDGPLLDRNPLHQGPTPRAPSFRRFLLKGGASSRTRLINE